MNAISKLIFFWYMFLTLLALCAAITIPLTSLLSGLMLIWIIFIFFFLGSNLTLHRTSLQAFNFIGREMAIPLGLVAFGTIYASAYASKFYTGNSVSEVIAIFRSGKSLYNQYQAYFNEQNIALFTVSKIPAVISLFYLKIVALYGFIYTIILNNKIKIKNCFYLIIITGSSLYFSFARGTTFELFELILLLWFCLIMRNYLLYKKRLSKKSKILFVTLALCALSVYSFNISARYSFGEVASCATTELCLYEDSILSQFSIILAKLTFKLSGYFTFGLFYTSQFIEEFWLSSLSQFFSLLIPFAIVTILN